VHTQSWVGPEMRRFYTRHLGEDWEQHLLDPEYWKAVAGAPDDALWAAHRAQKERLIRFVRERTRLQAARHGRSPDELRKVEGLLNPHALTVGFARRFATYKRATLLFSDPERLRRLLNHPERPVQFIFAGKAHPRDDEGKQILQRVARAAADPLFGGRIVFVENYDYNVARHLVQGSDIWLNTPRRPFEACGTSGMKAAVNGVLNLSILDGWWIEGFNGKNGWAFGDGEVTGNRDQADAEAIYEILEKKIIPLYYEVFDDGVPHGWVKIMKESIKSNAPRFSARRMVKEYIEKFYARALKEA